MSEQIVFTNRQDFIQAAFDQVASIVAQHGVQILDCFCPAYQTVTCLEQLSIVCNAYSYDFSKIDIYLQNIEKSNAELAEIGIE